MIVDQLQMDNNTGKIELPFKAIIFDMDGTLLESTEADYRAWERVFKHYGGELTYDNYVPMLGIRSADVIRNILGFTNETELARVLIEKYDHFVDYVNDHPVKPVAATDRFLQHLLLYDVKVGLATSSRQQKTMLLLKRLDFLQYFDAIVTGEQVENSKPAPDIFLKAANKLGVNPQDCLVVEDGPIGVAAAKSAGMKCIAITTTHPANKLQQADWIIDSYAGADISMIIANCTSGQC